MLAGRLFAVLVLELLAYALVLHAAARGAIPWAGALAGVCLAHVVLRCAAAPLGVIVAAWVEPAGRVPPLGPARALSTLWRECASLWWNYVLAPFEPWLRPGDVPGRGSPVGAPRLAPDVVLVHGILCNRVVWRPFQAALARRGYTSRAINLSPLLGSLDTMAANLAASLGGARGPIVIVAHSMGGLVARRALQLRPALAVAGIVTIGTPHQGSAQAELAPGEAARAMRRGSHWLQALARAGPPPAGVRRLAIRSAHDELVSPAESARWDGAAELVLTGVGHVAMLADARVIDAVVAEIDAVAHATRLGSIADHHDARPPTGALA